MSLFLLTTHHLLRNLATLLRPPVGITLPKVQAKCKPSLLVQLRVLWMNWDAHWELYHQLRILCLLCISASRALPFLAVKKLTNEVKRSMNDTSG